MLLLTGSEHLKIRLDARLCVQIKTKDKVLGIGKRRRSDIKMSAILLDNTFLSSVIENICIYKDDYALASCVKSYLYAIVLWDDVYALDGRGSMPRKNKFYDSKLGINRLTSYDESENISYISSEIYNEYWKNESDNWESKQFGESAIYYLLLGYNIGMNVMLSGERMEFIKRTGISQKIFSRADILELLDKEILKYYEEVNASIGKKYFTMKMPVLLDYISSHARDFQEAKDIAFRIKYDSEVIKFRKAMDLMDKALNNGNLVEFNNYIKIIPEIIDSITRNGLETKTINVGVSLSPSMTVPVKIGKIHLKKRMINMNFLIDLAKYGIMGKGPH